MAGAAAAWFAAPEARVTELLHESSLLLTPLGDPLLTDLGGHRWLASAREEAYSDWLQWVLCQVPHPADVFRLFRLTEPEGARSWPTGPPEVGREVTVPKGHAGSTGRLDVVVRCRGRALLVLELKAGTADAADTVKHAGYGEWLGAQPEGYKGAVLIATDAASEDYGGFRFVSWADVCLGLRRLARRDCRTGRVVAAALTLAFVGAVEQNLLGFHAPGPLSSGLLNPRLPEHLRRWAEQPDL